MLTAAVLAAASGCGNTAPRHGTGVQRRADTGASAARGDPGHRDDAGTACGVPAGADRAEDGIGPIYRLITRARSSVELTMYELADPRAEADLAVDAARGVDVRVTLDQHLEKSRNRGAYDYLASHGVHVDEAGGHHLPSKDPHRRGTTSVVMTRNLVAEDYPGTRDFAVIDTSHADIAAILATFNADFAGRAITPPDGTDLVWSPTNAQASVLSVINGAAHTLAVEDEEMDDPAVTSALAAAARRGVKVRITMTADPEWDQAFTELARAGAHIRLYPDNGSALYIHAKAIAANAGLPGQRVLVGSQNFSVASLDYNRELGIRTQTRPSWQPSAPRSARITPRPRPTPRRPRPQPAEAWGSRCTASASVYNAADDENNVYVHSNQPYQYATAKAGGYSHSYQTNGSGYALIYLNGPPPGAQITVTVGGATCTTSD